MNGLEHEAIKTEIVSIEAALARLKRLLEPDEVRRDVTPQFPRAQFSDEEKAFLKSLELGEV